MHHTYDDVLGAYRRALQTDPIWPSPEPPGGLLLDATLLCAGLTGDWWLDYRNFGPRPFRGSKEEAFELAVGCAVMHARRCLARSGHPGSSYGDGFTPQRAAEALASWRESQDDYLSRFPKRLTAPKSLWVHIADRVIQEATRRLEAEAAAVDPAEWYMAQFETEDEGARP